MLTPYNTIRTTPNTLSKALSHWSAGKKQRTLSREDLAQRQLGLEAQRRLEGTACGAAGAAAAEGVFVAGAPVAAWASGGAPGGGAEQGLVAAK